ncbi:MAG: NADH-quinone oxidoreductase subunit J [Planctomycetaceae bacterium]|nr:NADH-quinone oxidoreductase subunit J [Planctomycetaceae bacterium]
MPHLLAISIIAVVLGAVGVALMLPRGAARGRLLGGLLGAVALGLTLSQLPRVGQWANDALFLVLAAVTVVSAVGAVTFRNPVYCAIWFGQSLLGVAGLMLVAGAQFLAVATVVIYAGAILVTFLFVLMLAQPEGRAAYDRVSFEGPMAAATGIVIVGLLSITIGGVLSAGPMEHHSAQAMATGVLAPQHVARLGDELFGRHLLAVEVAGTLLLVALVGAAVIVRLAADRMSDRQSAADGASAPTLRGGRSVAAESVADRPS